MSTSVELRAVSYPDVWPTDWADRWPNETSELAARTVDVGGATSVTIKES